MRSPESTKPGSRRARRSGRGVPALGVGILAFAVVLGIGSPVLRAEDDPVELNRKALAAVETGDFPGAIALLRAARAIEPEDATLRTNLARVHGRYGAFLHREGRTSDALAELRSALALEPEAAEHHAQLGAVLFEAGRLVEAAECFREAIRLDPKDAVTHENLGHVHYKEGRTEDALRCWERSLLLDPSNAALRKKTEQVRREVKVEDSFLASDGSLFEIRYDGQIDPGLVDGIRGDLTAAFADVGAVFSFYPDKRVPVVLYTRAGFTEVTEGHRWAGGIFDGKIRVPLPASDVDHEALAATLKHEYTHFVVHSLAPKCPAWLHEGIAQWQEGCLAGEVRMRLADAAASGKLSPILGLTRSFARTEDPETVRLQYAEALSFVDFLVSRYGTGSLADLVRALGKEGSVEKAIPEVFGVDAKSMAAAWEDSLR